MSEPRELGLIIDETEITLQINQVLALQQIAIGQLIHWIHGEMGDRYYGVYQQTTQSRRQIEEALSRMNQSSKANENKDLRLIAFKRNKKRIVDFMARDPVLSSRTKFDQTLSKDLSDIKNGVFTGKPGRNDAIYRLDTLTIKADKRAEQAIKNRRLTT